MVVIKNVAVVGASGSIGEPVLKALITSGKFNITVLSRVSSKATFPPSVKVAAVDYTSVESLKSALQGQDAVVSTVGNEGLQGQSLIVDAAIAAGVKRFLPSEFGSDTENAKSAELPIFGYKIATQKHIEAKAAANPDFTYTYVVNGPFLDWGLKVGFLLNYQSGKYRLFDGGNSPFSTTTLSSVGQAVVGVLTHFEETKNRPVYVEDIRITQNQLLSIAQKVAPEKKWEVLPESLAEVKKAADEKLAKGDYSAIVEYLNLAVYGKEYGAAWPKLDNELLGVSGGKTEADIEALLKPLLK